MADPGRPPASRLWLQVLGVVVLIAAAGSFVFARWVKPPALPPRPVPVLAAAPPAEVSPKARVVGVQGVVERSTEAGPWQPVKIGEELKAKDAVRTGRDGAASLEVDGQSAITIGESSELGVREVSRAVHRFNLVRGRISADYRSDGGRVLRIEGEQGEVIAEADGARFSVLSTSAGFAVATQTGRVNLRSGGATVAIAAGQQSFGHAGAAPAPSTLIPAEVLLRVVSARKGLADACAVLEGTVAVGSTVRVEGEPVEVSTSGTFQVVVPRAPGREKVTLTTRDAAGRTLDKVVACAAPERPAGIKNFAIQWRKRAH